MSNALDIADMRAELIRRRHFTEMATHVIKGLSDRLRNRLLDDTVATPGDRSVLLDADLVLSEAYKLTVLEAK